MKAPRIRSDVVLCDWKKYLSYDRVSYDEGKKKKENQGNDGKYLSIYGVSFFFIIHDKTCTPSKPSTI